MSKADPLITIVANPDVKIDNTKNLIVILSLILREYFILLCIYITNKVNPAVLVG
jgi:hypothetical protein